MGQEGALMFGDEGSTKDSEREGKGGEEER